MTAQVSGAFDPEIVARGSATYRAKYAVMALILVGYGIWSFHDGFYTWPAENEAAARNGSDKPPHNHYSLLLNQGCAFLLPPLGVCCLMWSRYKSRGQYRLVKNVLSIPGHPPIPLEQIQAVDKTRWDTKGIAVLEYALTNPGVSGQATLDDYVYQRHPTDEIFKQVEASLLAAATPAARSIPAPGLRPAKLPPRPRL